MGRYQRRIWTLVCAAADGGCVGWALATGEWLSAGMLIALTLLCIADMVRDKSLLVRMWASAGPKQQNISESSEER